MSEKMPTFHYEENEQEYNYETLDSNEFLEPYDKMNIVGVCEGLKQVTTEARIIHRISLLFNTTSRKTQRP